MTSVICAKHEIDISKLVLMGNLAIEFGKFTTEPYRDQKHENCDSSKTLKIDLMV